MKKANNFKAVLFDLDGVLVDMPDGHYEALNKALGIFGANIEQEEHLNFFNGLSTRKKISRLEQQGRLPAGLSEFINSIKQKYTKEIIPKYCMPDYSKIIMVKELKDKGLVLGCCSNSIRETLDIMLKSAQLHDYFDLILGNDEITNQKPHPEIYLKAFAALKLKPEQCLIVEDAPAGIASAKSSGGKVIEVRGVQDVNLSLFKDFL